MNYKVIRSFTFLFALLLLDLWGGVAATAGVLARGDGFVIDSGDVEAQKDYFLEKGFESTDQEHLNSVLKVRLFALEAKNSGLISSLPEATDTNKKETTQEYYRLFLLYYTHLMETYPVSEEAINSYYLSYPEKFLLNANGPKQDIKKQDLWALDADMKNWIRNKIVLSQKAVIIENEFERLKTKNHVVIEK